MGLPRRKSHPWSISSGRWYDIINTRGQPEFGVVVMTRLSMRVNSKSKNAMTQLEMKKYILHCLEENNLDDVVSFVQKERKTLSLLIRMAYDKDTLVGWRAIKAVGRVAKALAGTNHEFLRIAVRKLLWSLSDESGGIGWAAPELLGEIVSSESRRFCRYNTPDCRGL